MQEWLNLWLSCKKMMSLINKDLVKAAHMICMLHHMIQGNLVNKAPITGIASIIQGHGHTIIIHRLTKDQLVRTHMIWILAPMM